MAEFITGGVAGTPHTFLGRRQEAYYVRPYYETTRPYHSDPHFLK